MLILLSYAKTMAASASVQTPAVTEPRFSAQANDIALQATRFSPDELKRLLHVNADIAARNYRRFREFHSADNRPLPALLAYTGIVFKRLRPAGFTPADFLYAQDHLRLTSFCYGLLRPLDLIRNYRLEGRIELAEPEGVSLFDFWKPLLTDVLIDDVRRQGGVLVNLASAEMKQLFDWKRVQREVRIVTPEFRVQKDGKLATIVVYTKMARGEMARFILKNRLASTDELKHFTFDGFAFRPQLSNDGSLVFTLEA